MLDVSAIPVTSENAQATETAVVPDGRGGRTPRDMALSLIVLLVPIILILAIYRGLHGGDALATVDPAPEIARAAQAGLTLVPRELPADWKVATASYNGLDKTLRLGYLTGGNGGLQLVEAQRDGLAKAELSKTAAQTGTVSVGGVEWQTWTGRADENGLVRTVGGITIVISGRVPQADLVDLAAHL
jgi:hypothetical protein